MRTAAWLVGLLGLAACESVARQEAEAAKQARWKSVEVAAPSDRVLWQLGLLSLQSQGFPLGPGTDPGLGLIESGWRTDLQPFRGQGQRRRAEMKMTPLEKGRWKLEARVRREKNQNLVTPLDAVRAEWEPMADDEALAQVLLQHVRSRLAPEIKPKERESPPKP